MGNNIINLHEVLKPYEYNSEYYKAEAAEVLFKFLEDYEGAHPWFNYFAEPIVDSSPHLYFHYAVIYWTEGHRPTLNIFNFTKNKKLSERNITRKIDEAEIGGDCFND